MRVEVELRNWSVLEIDRPVKKMMKHNQYPPIEEVSERLVGRLVFLDRYDPAGNQALLRQWRQHEDYLNLFAGDPLETECERLPGSSYIERFVIRSLESGQLIGEIALQKIDWVGKKASLGVAIGESECWGKGYGTDAVRVLMRYAFDVLRLSSVSLEMR